MKKSKIHEIMSRLWAFSLEQPLGIVGAILLLALIVLAVGAPLWVQSDPTATAISKRLLPPSIDAWFGTDNLGRDVWSRFVYGARTSMLVGVTAVLLASFIGGLIGIFSGLVGGRLDSIVQRTADALLSMPAILLAIIIMAVLGTSAVNLIIAITIPYIPRINRLTRATDISLRELPFVESAAVAGASKFRITLLHIAPNCVAPWLVYASALLATAFLAQATLSFLGLGVPPPTASWGRDISEHLSRMEGAPWLVIFPGLGISMAVFAANFLGDSLRNILDPKLKRI